MKDFGTVRPGSTLYIEFDSFGADGESLTLTGLAVTDIEVYRDGSTTQRASDAGYTLLDTDGIDFDSLTGIHGFSINLADNTTSGFWAAGSHYRVVVSAVTINSQTVSFTAATFRIGYPSAVLNTTIATLANQTSFTLTNGPAEDDALNGMWAIIHDAASAVQFSKVLISDYNGSTKTVTLAAGATFTAAAGDNFSLMDMAPLQPMTTGRMLVVDTAGTVDLQTIYGTDIGLTGAANLVAFFDGTGYAGTNNVIPTVTNLTNLPTIPTNWLTATGLATSAVDEIRDAIIAIFTDDVGTAQAGAAGTITLQSGASSTDDYYNNAVVVITGGTGAGQSRQITDYVGSTRVASVDTNWVTNPDNTSTYIVLGRIV